jgi:hypothetical protein
MGRSRGQHDHATGPTSLKAIADLPYHRLNRAERLVVADGFTRNRDHQSALLVAVVNEVRLAPSTARAPPALNPENGAHKTSVQHAHGPRGTALSDPSRGAGIRRTPRMRDLAPFHIHYVRLN